MGSLTVLAEPGREVRVEQIRHEFWFGSAIADEPFGWPTNSPDATKYKEMFLKNFNAGAVQNVFKWHRMEPRQGEVDFSMVDTLVDWATNHEIPLRGHCIFWGKSWNATYGVSKWQKELGDDELRAAVKARATTIGEHYKGRFAEYDLNNEMMHGNYYADRLGPQITKQMADWVREGDPEAVLYLNDFDILTGKRLDQFVKHVRDMLEQGVPVGGLGVQGHSHRDSFDREVLEASLAKLSELGLPIRITEFNMPGMTSRHSRTKTSRLTTEYEEAKAKALVDYYRICFAQPAVKGIIMWGFWEGANWLPGSSLYRRDWTPTPAAHAYRELVYREWWTDWTGKADEAGRCEIRAFHGRHRVTVGEKSKVVELTSDGKGITVLLR